jgi:predicted nucleic acid-binding protein
MSVAEGGQAYFLDTSALVKLYHQELGSDVVEAWAATPSIRLWVSDLARIELHSVFSRKVREGELAEAALQRVLECFREDLLHRFQLVPLTPGLIERAIGFLIEHGQTHPLRTLDALQMASALVVESPVLIFVTADKRLLATASQVFPRALNPEVQSEEQAR